MSFKRIYKSKRAVVYCGDCLEVISGWSTGLVDLLVTDPPYGVNWKSNRGFTSFERIQGDVDAIWVPAALTEISRVLRKRRHAYVFGRFDLLKPYATRAELIWDKVYIGSGDVTSAYGPAHEPITFATHGKGQAEDGKIPARLRQGSVLRYPRKTGRGVGKHPTEKPVPLLRRLVESSSFPGEIVLGPFAGSGSTGVAALLEGRRAILIDVDRGYCDMTIERLREVEAWLEGEPS